VTFRDVAGYDAVKEAINEVIEFLRNPAKFRTQQLPRSERHLYTRRDLLDTIAVQLSGRAAEELAFGDQSTGAANDLAEATQTARRMVREWGMSEKLGPMAWGSPGAVLLGDDLVRRPDWSDATAHLVDDEVERILTEQDLRARQILGKHRAALEAVAHELVEHETVDGETVARLAAETIPTRPVSVATHHPAPRRPRRLGTV
jgi:cell division protease FtsH